MNKQRVIAIFNELPTKRKKVLLGLLRGDNQEKIMVDADVPSPDALTQHKRKLYADFGIDTVQHELDDSRSGERKLHKLVALFAKYMPELISPQRSQLGEASLPQDRERHEIIAKGRQDWIEAPNVPLFFGRTEELAKLKQWIITQRCQLVVLLGMGGIGKTALAVKLAEQIQGEFDYLIWRSLRNAPPLEILLADVIKFLSEQQEINFPDAVDARIMQLIRYLHQHRCLLVLDNAESILKPGERAGYYREGYECYGELLRQVGESRHQSCLVLTSREKPKEISPLEEEELPVRSCKLTGLAEAEGQQIFQKKGFFFGSEEEWKILVKHYAGNPLALKIVAAGVLDVFVGNISQLIERIKQGEFVFDDMRDLLERQFNRLSESEKDIMYWLAINRDFVSLSELQEDIVSPAAKRELPDILNSLIRKSLIETSGAGYTLQLVVMEYVTERLIAQFFEEIITNKIKFFNTHALLKALAKDYVRKAQVRFIIQPIWDSLIADLGNQNHLEAKLKQILSTRQEESPREPEYVGGNIINLLSQMQANLRGYDFSNLAIWQAYLQDVNLHEVNFADAEIVNSVVVWSVAFNPDGNLLVIGSNNCTIKIWNIHTNQCVCELQGHTERVYSVAFSPDGKLVASGSSDRTVRIWDVDTGQLP